MIQTVAYMVILKSSLYVVICMEFSKELSGPLGGETCGEESQGKELGFLSFLSNELKTLQSHYDFSEKVSHNSFST